MKFSIYKKQGGKRPEPVPEPNVVEEINAIFALANRMRLSNEHRVHSSKDGRVAHWYDKANDQYFVATNRTFEEINAEFDGYEKPKVHKSIETGQCYNPGPGPNIVTI